MIIYPAVDLMGGRAVRLRQGRKDDVTDYGDPVKMAAKWHDAGASWLHIVDLEAAFEGQSNQGTVIRQMVKAFSGQVQLGGGIRTLADIRIRLEEWGVTRCILGTIAVTDPALVEQACRLYPGRIACGIDAHDGMVAVKGWVETSTVSALDLARNMAQAGVTAIIYTDIARDGMLEGPNTAATKAMVEGAGVPIIASGGVSSLVDLFALREAGCAGAIVGKALYTGAISLQEALNTLK